VHRAKAESARAIACPTNELCKVPDVAAVKMVAHNNKAQEFEQRIATSCSKK
jgi:hypothetical protein